MRMSNPGTPAPMPPQATEPLGDKPRPVADPTQLVEHDLLALSAAIGNVSVHDPIELDADAAAALVHALKVMSGQLASTFKAAEQRICDAIEAGTFEPGAVETEDGTRLHPVRVQATRVEFPDVTKLLAALREANIDDDIIDEFTTVQTKISTPNLEKQIEAGTVSADVVAPFAVTKPSAPYLRFEPVTDPSDGEGE